MKQLKRTSVDRGGRAAAWISSPSKRHAAVDQAAAVDVPTAKDQRRAAGLDRHQVWQHLRGEAQVPVHWHGVRGSWHIPPQSSWSQSYRRYVSVAVLSIGRRFLSRSTYSRLQPSSNPLGAQRLPSGASTRLLFALRSPCCGCRRPLAAVRSHHPCSRCCRYLRPSASPSFVLHSLLAAQASRYSYQFVCARPTRLQ